MQVLPLGEAKDPRGGGGGEALSWLLACNSNKYEVIVHSQNNSPELFLGDLGK